MEKRPAVFFSGSTRLAADLYAPTNPPPEGGYPGVALCCGYTGVKDLYLDEMARRLARFGYVALTFDYKGWGMSEGPPLRLAPFGRVEDALASITYLASRPDVDPRRIGLFGISYGGSTATFAAAIDRRVGALVSVTGVGDGERWMRRVRRPWEYRELLARSLADRERQVESGVSELVDRAEVLQQDPRSLEIAARARAGRPGAAMMVPLEMVHETVGFNPEWVVDRIAPRASLFITSDADEMVPPEESELLYARAGEPKRLVVLQGYGHYDVFTSPALDRVMDEARAWFDRHLPPRR